jgi:hypothetical protein
MPVRTKVGSDQKTAPRDDVQREEAISRLLGEPEVKGEDQAPEPVQKPKPSAIVRLIVGMSNISHGKSYLRDRPFIVTDEARIEEFKHDGNFSVEMVAQKSAG